MPDQALLQAVDPPGDEFASIADASPAPMWVTGLDRRRTFANKAYEAFLGVAGAAARDFDWRTIIHPDDEARVVAQSLAGEASLQPFTLEGRYRNVAGDWRWLQSVSQPRFDDAGRHIGFIGVAHDVTDARVAAAALREREEQLSAVIQQTGAGLAQVDTAGRFTLVNDRFCAIVGWTAEQLAERTMQSITHPDDLLRNLSMFDAAVRHGTPYAHEKRCLRPDGSIVWVHNTVSVIRRPDGTPYGILAVTQDITARRAADEALRESEARLGFLDDLASATHDAGNADAVLAITTRMLGEYLDLSDCAYADVDEDEDGFHIRGDWHAPDAASIVGDYRLAGFGPTMVARLRGGLPLIVDDCAAELSAEEARAFAAIGVRATICVPFLKAGRLAGLMAIHDSAPRRWQGEELALVRAVADRSWAHVERVRAEAALRDSERRLRLAMEGARIGTWDWDFAARRGNWSARTAAIFGLPQDRLLTARERAAMIHPDDRERIAAAQERLATEGSDFTTEYRIIRPDGAVRWVSSHGALMRDEAGRVTRAIGTIRDVTPRREAQEKLQALAQTLESQVAERTAERDRMWRLSGDLMLVIGSRRRVTAVNPAIAALGYRPEEVIDRPIAGLIHPDDRNAALAVVRAGAYRPIGEFHARLRTRDGDWRWFAWSAAPGEGEAYVIGRDVTAEIARRDELEQAQEQLRQAQKMESLGQLTGGVAHDFNNLLTPILGSLDLLARSDALSDRHARLVRGALESAERARVLVQRLLAFARRQPLQAGPVDLGVLVEGMTALVASTVGAQVRIELERAPGLPSAMADANQLEMALLNLAVNARDAMPDGGTLMLTIAPAEDAATADLPPGRYLSLAVADTGTGMDAATAARAVEPFFSTKGVGRGTGLGLSMVHGLTSQLGGALRLETAPGAGTRVELLLPVAADPLPSAPAEASAATASRGGSVLLVDDEDPVRDATAAMLASLGYRVTTAASGKAALALLGDDPDLLVTDHIMPGMTGADLARLARARRPDLKVLLISGYAALDQVPPDLPRLAKPFRVAELARSLAAL